MEVVHYGTTTGLIIIISNNRRLNLPHFDGLLRYKNTVESLFKFDSIPKFCINKSALIGARGFYAKTCRSWHWVSLQIARMVFRFKILPVHWRKSEGQVGRSECCTSWLNLKRTNKVWDWEWVKANKLKPLIRRAPLFFSRKLSEISVLIHYLCLLQRYRLYASELDWIPTCDKVSSLFYKK